MDELEVLAPYVVEMHRLPEYSLDGLNEKMAWQKAWVDWTSLDLSVQAHMFMLGAIADAIVGRWGEVKVREFAHEARCSTSLIYERASTYRAWKGKQVNPVMSYYMHKQAARMAKITGKDPEVVLADFEDRKLSTRQAEAEIAQVQGKALEPYNPDPYPVPTPKLHARIEMFKEHVRAQPCLVCGSKGKVEAAHFKGLINPKTGELGVRRQGLSDWLVLPLCAVDHRTGPESLHNIGETQFLERHFGGLDIVIGLWATILLTWLERWD